MCIGTSELYAADVNANVDTRSVLDMKAPATNHSTNVAALAQMTLVTRAEEPDRSERKH